MSTPEDRTFYQSKAWFRARGQVLKRDPVCVECRAEKATHCDHIKSRRLFPELALDIGNLRGLCTTCHNSRSARQYSDVGGVGLDGEPLDPNHPWHAGESTRVTFSGTDRAPPAWQHGALRGDGRVNGDRARGSVSTITTEESDALPFALPPMRRH
jgi:hypothetical protein